MYILTFIHKSSLIPLIAVQHDSVQSSFFLPVFVTSFTDNEKSGSHYS